MKNTFIEILNTQHRHRTAAIPGTTTSVPNYPKKLKIYLNNASPYWQAMYFDQGTTYRHSCKTTDKNEAYEQARAFYEMLILKKYQHQRHLEFHEPNLNDQKPKATLVNFTFHHIANEWLQRKAVRWTPRHKTEVSRRLNNNLIPFIGNRNIQRIAPGELLALLQKIEERGAFDLAKRALNDCRQIWAFAIASGVAPEQGLVTAIAQEIAKAGVGKDDTVLLYCQSGRRSGIALDTLKGLGFSKAENVGGIEQARKTLAKK